MRRERVTPIAELKKKAESLWKEIAYLRFGRVCWVRRNYPQIRIAHTDIIQIDHFISRSNKHLFLDPRNALPVCSSCNRAKHYRQKSVDKAIENMIREREGHEVVDQMIALDMTKTANRDFSKRWYLEERISELQAYKEKLEQSRPQEISWE